jgi:hypothetical protein
VEALHHYSDAVTSAAAFVGIAIAVWAGPGYEMADDWAAVLACGADSMAARIPAPPAPTMTTSYS